MRNRASQGAVLLATAALLLSFLMAVPAQAASHRTVQSQVQHYLECLNWLYTNPAKHKKFCEPGHEFWLDDNATHGPHFPSPPPVVPVVPPPATQVVPDQPGDQQQPNPTPNCPSGPKDGWTHTAYVLTGFGGENGPPGNGCPGGKPDWPDHGGGDCNGVALSAPLLSSDPQVILAGMKCYDKCAAYITPLDNFTKVIPVVVKNNDNNKDDKFKGNDDKPNPPKEGKPEEQPNDHYKPEGPLNGGDWDHKGGKCPGGDAASFKVIESWSNSVSA